MWVSFSALKKRIMSPKHDTEQKIYIQARDSAAIEEYEKWLERRNSRFNGKNKPNRDN